MIRSICLAIGTLVFVTNGETLLVPSQYPTIQEAANAAVSGDVIQIAAGTYQEFDILCSDVTILGETGNNGIPVTRIDSSNLGRSLICSGSQVSIQNIEFENFAGNAITCESLEEVVIQNCNLIRKGEQVITVQISANNSILTGCRFEASQLQFTYFGDSPNVQVSGCHFEDSGIYSDVSLNINDCTFSGRSQLYTRYSDCNFSSLRTLEESLCYLTHDGQYQNPATFDDLIGSFAISIRRGSQSVLKNSTIEGVGSVSFPCCTDPCFVILCDDESSLQVRNSTVSNNVVSDGCFNAAILNYANTPILIQDSIVCGNSPLNIYGLYSLENSFLLPNCGSFEGSCCSSSECLTVTEEQCISLGGSWRGTNVPCSSVTCAPPDQFGTCCVNDESVKLFESDCNRIGGTFEGSVPDGFVCPPSLTCEGDITNNGDVGLPDLIAVLSNWGPCPG